MFYGIKNKAQLAKPIKKIFYGITDRVGGTGGGGQKLVGQLGFSLYGSNNLVPSQLSLREALPRPEKVSLGFFQH